VDAATKRARRFDLRRVARYREKTYLNYDININPQQTPYEYLKLQGYSVPVEAIVSGQTETVAWQPYRDPRLKFHYPRLVRHPDPDIMKRINALLEQRHWQMTLEPLTCKTHASYYGEQIIADYDAEPSINVVFLSETLMSIVENVYTPCAKTGSYHHFTLDLILGEEMDWNRIFKAFTGHKYERKYSPEMEALIARIPQNPKWFEEYNPNYSSSSKEDEEHLNSCLDVLKSYPILHFDKPDYLALAVSSSGGCSGVLAEIPFSALGKILKPEARRYFPELEGK
jgi:hypothetical protein